MRAGLPSSRCFDERLADLDRRASRSGRCDLRHLARACRGASGRCRDPSDRARSSTVAMSATGIDLVLDVDDVRDPRSSARPGRSRRPRGCGERNWLPSPSPFEAPRTRPAMSTKLMVVGRMRSGLHDLVERLEARVGHDDDADVRLDGAERVVRRLGLGRRERVEERALADVRQANDADRETHGRGSSPKSPGRAHGGILPPHGTSGRPHPRSRRDGQHRCLQSRGGRTALFERGARVLPVMTHSAGRFVGAVTLAGNYRGGGRRGHVGSRVFGGAPRGLGEGGRLVAIVPATADCWPASRRAGPTICCPPWSFVRGGPSSPRRRCIRACGSIRRPRGTWRSSCGRGALPSSGP